MSAAVTMPARRERPMIFSAPMIKAIQADMKTQTRRLARFELNGLNPLFSGLSAAHYHTGVPAEGWCLYSRDGGGVWNARTPPLKSPYGVVGDRIWVRETWALLTGNGHRIVYRADGIPMTCGGTEPVRDMKWTPSIYMRRQDSRFTLEITDVRVERLHSITEEDAKAEGVTEVWGTENWSFYDQRTAAYLSTFEDPSGKRPGIEGVRHHPPALLLMAREKYAQLWDEINGKRARWVTDPWIWRISFRRVEVT